MNRRNKCAFAWTSGSDPGDSPYYPPRARWFSPLLNAAGGLRRRLCLDRVHMPRGVPFGAGIACFLVPGLGFYLRGPRLWGRLVLGACPLLALAFFLWLGHFAANVAFGLLLSIHICSLAYLFEPWMAGERFRARLGFGLLLLVALGCGLYLPARNFIQGHWFMPLQVGGKVVVVQKRTPVTALHRGDWIAYSFDEARANVAENVRVRGGLGCGPVLALPGDRVCFGLTTFAVNGRLQRRLPHMPQEGEWMVPEKHWFLWPNLAIGGNRIASEAALGATLKEIGTVPEERYVGKACRRWFWHRQLES